MASRPTARPILPRTLSSQSTASTDVTASFSPRSRRNKPRLYLALYSRTTSGYRNLTNCDDAYHWSFLVGPKTAILSDPFVRYHIRHDLQSACYYAEDDRQTAQAQRILFRVTLAKVVDHLRLERLLRDVVIPPRSSNTSKFTCLSWVRAAFQSLLEDGKCLKGYISISDWKDIEETARRYGKQKRGQRRFTGEGETWNVDNIPTYNYWERRETTS